MRLQGDKYPSHTKEKGWWKSMQKKLIDVIETLAYECDYDLSQYNVDELEQIQRDLEAINIKLSNLNSVIETKELDSTLKKIDGISWLYDGGAE